MFEQGLPTVSGLIALVAVAGCRHLDPNPRGREPLTVDASHPRWLAEVLDERHGGAAFERLTDRWAPHPTGHDWQGLVYAAAAPLEGPSGVGAVVALDRNYWVCTRRDWHPGGIQSPYFSDSNHAAVVLLDQRGHPTYVGRSGRGAPQLVLTDANGDGQVEEVLYFDNEFSYDGRPPFLTIFSLREGSPRALLSLKFNADAEVEVSDGSPVFGDLVLEGNRIVINMVSPFDPNAGRRGGWALARSPSGYNDLILYETVDGISRLVARFPYLPERGYWQYPEMEPQNALWSVPNFVLNPFERLHEGGVETG